MFCQTDNSTYHIQISLQEESFDLVFICNIYQENKGFLKLIARLIAISFAKLWVIKLEVIDIRQEM